MENETIEIVKELPPAKVMLVALDLGKWDCERSLAELSALAEANHMETAATLVQKKQAPEAGTVLGEGKLAEGRLVCANLGIDAAIFDGELTGSQIRNLTDRLGVEVLDRTMLILEIFQSRAVTGEGKLQTELAMLRYRLPRLQGLGEALSRQGGGGGGAAGARRGENRRARQKSGIPVISLVGYTNVGKSSLLNALCGSYQVMEANMLFATLDPTARRLTLPSGLDVVIVDTVGFVSRLPHHLVEAFKSTLEEAAFSDVIVKVADACDPERMEQLMVTDEVLQSLDCADIPQLVVYNKCDAAQALSFDPDVLLTSAKTGKGLPELLAALDKLLAHRVRSIKILLPYDKLGLADAMRTRGSICQEEYRQDGVYYEGIVKVDDLHLYEPYMLEN